MTPVNKQLKHTLTGEVPFHRAMKFSLCTTVLNVENIPADLRAIRTNQMK